jgi:hypothetical protein
VGRYLRIQLSGKEYLSLAEVQVMGFMGPPPPPHTVSGKITLSGGSTGLPGVSVALRGDGSATTTTDASGIYSFSNVPDGSNVGITPTRAGYSMSPSSATFNNLSADQIANFSATIAPSNLALGKTATQSSTLTGYGVNAIAGMAVDGNTDGNFGHASLSTTNSDSNAWWQVDLGASATVTSVVVWNRTDCCGYRLGDYWVFLSDTPFSSSDTPATLQNRAGTWNSHQTSAPDPSVSIPANGVVGRYLRIQLSGKEYLSLAEVQVIGY